MRLTDTTDYSLRVLIYLNRTKSLATLNELSGKLKISRNTLIQISHRLAKKNYIEASRGRSGGLKIKESTGQTKLGDIITNTEENMFLASCFAGGPVACTLYRGCQLKICLHEALSAFTGSLNQYTLDDIT